ncbi:C39 family peptidase [Fictibacillus iocasae]|uniref:C39 family peptidase n=1 Tax=Fictibacillus iocasae TaxID=2715437 RepID=A0ABW2NL01_9BACL
MGKKKALLLVPVFMAGALVGVVQNEDQKTYVVHDSSFITPVIPAVKSEIKLNVPRIGQYPELPRGCEVTSLAMLLQYSGVSVDKMRLAKEVKKTTEPYVNKDGAVSYGHPNEGFVGDIYSLNNMGYGVYHKPIAMLAENYTPGRILDLTGAPFSQVLSSLQDNKPVWIITNVTYDVLPDSEFRTWQTPQGIVKITWKEHSVLITGYDKEYVYFNDPLLKKERAPRDKFIAAWEQMGSQAITYSD